MSESVTVLALNSDESGLERMKVNANKHLIVDNTQNTQPVSGAFYPATQPISTASALLVDGSAVTQPVSGSVSISGTVATTGGALSVANNSMFSAEVINMGSSAQSAGLDVSASLNFVIYGDTNNTSDEVGVELSFDNSVWYDAGFMIYPDGTTGNFAKEVLSSAKYIRINKKNDSGASETISASVMVKS